jgi:hypothetical protein
LAVERAGNSLLTIDVVEPPARTSWKKPLFSILLVLLAVATAILFLFNSRPALQAIEPSPPLSHIGDQPLLLRGEKFNSWLTVRVYFPPTPGKNETPFGDLPAHATTWHGQHTATCLIDFNSRPFPHSLQLRHPLGLHSNILPLTVEQLIQAPIIDGIAPSQLRVKNEEQLLLVYGAHFQQGPQVNLKSPAGGQDVLNPQLIERPSPGVIRLRLYFYQAGQYELQVINSNGRRSQPFSFTVTGK